MYTVRLRHLPLSFGKNISVGCHRKVHKCISGFEYQAIELIVIGAWSNVTICDMDIRSANVYFVVDRLRQSVSGKL